MSLPDYSLGASALLLVAGVFLLTSREGYAPSDRADRWLRRGLRIAVLFPVAWMIIVNLNIVFSSLSYTQSYFVTLAAVALSSLIPLLLFLHLRGLAKRVRSPHLAEHCAIVGTGATFTCVYLAALIIAKRGSEPEVTRGNFWLVLMLIASVSSSLFFLWSFYLMVRFAIAFHLAARHLRRKWRRDDRAMAA
jgi:hypothetical protein